MEHSRKGFEFSNEPNEFISWVFTIFFFTAFRNSSFLFKDFKIAIWWSLISSPKSHKQNPIQSLKNFQCQNQKTYNRVVAVIASERVNDPIIGSNNVKTTTLTSINSMTIPQNKPPYSHTIPWKIHSKCRWKQSPNHHNYPFFLQSMRVNKNAGTWPITCDTSFKKKSKFNTSSLLFFVGVFIRSC